MNKPKSDYVFIKETEIVNTRGPDKKNLKFKVTRYTKVLKKGKVRVRDKTIKLSLTPEEIEHLKDHDFSDCCSTVWDIMKRVQQKIHPKNIYPNRLSKYTNKIISKPVKVNFTTKDGKLISFNGTKTISKPSKVNFQQSFQQSKRRLKNARTRRRDRKLHAV